MTSFLFFIFIAQTVTQATAILHVPRKQFFFVSVIDGLAFLLVKFYHRKYRTLSVLWRMQKFNQIFFNY